jgi:hypothetical protein
MKTTLAITLVCFPIVAAAADEDFWFVHYRIVGELASDWGIKVFSHGGTAVCADEICAQSKHCEDVLLGSDETDSITADLVALAEAMPPGSSLTIDDRCEGESEHNVLVYAFGESRLFQHSVLEACRSSIGAPGWMVSLTDKLYGIKARMNPCMDDLSTDN